MTDEFALIELAPTPEEYRNPRKAAGWFDIDFYAMKVGLSNSQFSVCVIHNDKVIGCGRVIGDGGLYYYIQDVIVLPKYQKRGLGKLIMDSIMKFFDENIQPITFIGLMAAKGQSKFYKQFGFNERPEYGPGMYLV